MQVGFGMVEVFSLLVPPIAFCAAGKIVQHAWRDRKFTETFPLLLVQLNSVFVWTNKGCYQLFTPVVNLHSTIFRYQAIDSMLYYSLYLEPINCFLYTWRLLKTLENEKQGKTKQACRLYRVISVWMVPIVYLLFYVAIVLVSAKYY